MEREKKSISNTDYNIDREEEEKGEKSNVVNFFQNCVYNFCSNKFLDFDICTL